MSGNYKDFLERNGLPDIASVRELYEDSIRRVKLFLAVESLKNIGGSDEVIRDSGCAR